MIAIVRAVALAGLATAATGATAPQILSLSLTQPAQTRQAEIAYSIDGAGFATFQFKTNGVDILHALSVRAVTGDINCFLPTDGTYTFTWDAGSDMPERVLTNLTVEMTLWSPATPPTWCAVGLTDSEAPLYWYGKESEVPYGITDSRWKESWLLLRKVPDSGGQRVVQGSPSVETGRSANEAIRWVRITRPFYLGIYQITQQQWQNVMGGTPPAYWSSPTWRDQRPVEQVSYNTIRGSVAQGVDWPGSGALVAQGSFMDKLRERVGRCLEFDLPTEAQWEYACRAGTLSAWNNGTTITAAGNDDNLNLLGRNSYNGGQFVDSNNNKRNPDAVLGGVVAVTTSNATAAVGSYLPNAWQLYDMHANVWEWCLDWYVADMTSYAGDDPIGPVSGSERVVRGGCLNNGCSSCRSARRDPKAATTATKDVGFRVGSTAIFHWEE